MDYDPKGMRRGKPPQKLYRPGSGPLKKSQDEIDNAKSDLHNVDNETTSSRRGHGRHRGGQSNKNNFHNNDINKHSDEIVDKLQGVNISNDDHKKSKQKKPEQQIYIPKNRNLIEREENNSSPSHSDTQISENSNKSVNAKQNDQHTSNDRLTNPESKDSHNNHDARYKRYPRRGAHESNNESDNGRRGDNRQNSEPRNLSPNKGAVKNHTLPRNRDTRSMESAAHRYSHHSNGGKPPSGRRNSTNVSASDINIDSLPPRFRKKLLEKNEKMTDETMQAQWDGNSVVFQGHPGSSNPPPHPSYRSQTLPGRGRGHNRREEFDKKPLQSFDSAGESMSTTPHINRTPGLIGNDENILIDKLTNQSLQNRLTNKKEDNTSLNKNYKTQHNNNVHSDKNGLLSQSGDVNNSNGHSWAAELPISTPSTAIHKGFDIHDKAMDTSSRLPKPPISVTIEGSKGNIGWGQEVEDYSRLVSSLKGENTMHKNVLHPDVHSTSSEIGQDKFNDTRQNADNRLGRASSNRQGRGSEQKAEGGKQSGRSKKKRAGVKKRNAGNRSSSRSSQKGELNTDNTHQRSDRSPHSQAQNREVRDHYRENKENVSHRDGRDHIEKDKSRDRRGPHRNDNNDVNRIPNHQWQRNSYSRENSRERRCFSRNNSGERGGPGSRPGSRDRLHPYGPPSNSIHQPLQKPVIIDPEKIKLPPPPPPASRSSRNQIRRDSWSGKGSRHASIESGPGDIGHSPHRGSGSGSNRRRRRRDSDNRHISTSSSNNWREEMHGSDRHDVESRRGPRTESIGNSGVERRNESSVGKAPGILVLPQEKNDSRIRDNNSHQNRGNSHNMPNNSQGGVVNRTLYDWRNPSKPIQVSQNSVASGRMQEPSTPHQSSETHSSGRPSYYDTNSESFNSSRNQGLIREVERADKNLQWYFKYGTDKSDGYLIIRDWDKIMQIRSFLQHSLQTLLATDLKFCQSENIEHNFWKLLYYNFIEVMRKTMSQDESIKPQFTEMINNLIKDGNAYFESLLELLQNTYKFQLDDYLNAHYVSPPKGLGFVGLALISAQKVYIFLGDLARYKELVNDTSNYAKSKNWYTKANQINPKNGRPYNQLAILAVYARRKLDAVYFYMRSLMSSNPFHSARESLITMFDENRKKYEASERKRLAERQKAVEVVGGSRGLRREVWTRVGGERTTKLFQPDRLMARAAISDDEELSNMSSIELNKKFITSYLHVHGKLITKIGMESLSGSATTMLRQFRALLRHTPLPINCSRLLQLTALNMFAIESAQLKEPTSAIVGGGCRSEVQERALAVSLRMFGALLERCCTLLSATVETSRPRLPVHDDVIVILPAIKVWCEWMMIHRVVWNPPPPSDDFDDGDESDPWPKLAKLMNLLEPLELQRTLLKSVPTDDDEVVRLPEDTQLAGFTPLMYSAPETVYAPRTLDPEAAKLAVRAHRLLFFGTEYLCGVDPPALERRLAGPDCAEYVSVVRRRQPDDDRGRMRDRRDSSGDSDIMEASLSEEEDVAGQVDPVETNWAAEEFNDEMTKKLLRRRGQLEHRRRDCEKRRLRMQALLRQGQVSVELEVRPRYLVPDTNCFIDHLPRLQRLIVPDANTPYILVVPLVVVSELEGLTRALRVGDAAREALEVLRVRRPSLRFATTRGNILSTATFTAEQDTDNSLTNDDRILATSLSLCRSNIQQQLVASEAEDNAANTSTGAENILNVSAEVGADGVKRLIREVVLLTDDRNLRVKAIVKDLPVKDLTAFMRWAAID